MLVLGIESTAHTFGVAVVREERVLANVRKMFVTEEGGMVPSKVADFHVAHCGEVLQEALKKAQVGLDEVDGIAYSASPGIGHCLRIGAALARSLALRWQKPLLAVNHCIAHLEVGRVLCRVDDPVLLYASGANTQVIAFEGGRYRVFGETLDIGVGNFLDALGRYLGFGFPAGPTIERYARCGTRLLDVPYVVKGMDTSFGGILTNLHHKIVKGACTKEDVCFTAQEVVFAMLVEVAERALAHTGKKELVLGGGVACNARLQEMASIMCEERGAVCRWPEKEFLVDNAAMIAINGVQKLRVGDVVGVEHAGIDPGLRTDEVVVTWRP
ncbi:tRNA (adenosine(37)-N6)-threonylcarbamoyltransferase complex transferase subunit TsaD [Candidatus Woesearchaeota archaeon]|nr:MAG: tRNA (adenosine(37)-N6)-threonylcarbamoyltransferase complex transferase subunit TsaD [Candidatus Woesearchaeota archaeon]